MHTSKSIKSTAKSQLYPNWSKAYAAMGFILMATLCLYLAQRLVEALLSGYGIIKSTAITFEDLSGFRALANAIIENVKSESFIFALVITLFFLVLRFLIISPLEQGQYKWYYSVAKGSKTYLSKVFFYYKTNSGYISLLLFRVGKIIRQIFYGIISFIAAIAALSLSIYQLSLYSQSVLASDRNKAVLYLIVTAFLLLLGVVLYTLLMIKYFLADYLFAAINDFDGGIKKVNSCFSRSKELMTGQSGRVISLAISFIPAILSCVLIVPILYVYPYMNASFAVLARDIIKEAKESEKSSN